MRSWPSAPLPTLPGRGPELRLYDTSDRQVRPVAAGPTATMYVCGITPYDATHLGHAATYLAFDLVQRLWLDLGHDVHYVQNVTDVDDPLFERANRDGLDWRDLAAREVALFCDDMTALRVLPPREYVAATEAVAEVVELVEKMLASGAAYVVDDPEYPDVYFRADATVQFGYESGYDRDSMLRLFAERGGDPDRRGKTDQLDALLWRAARPGEPSWPSSFGRGRPGWHVECAAIALSRIGSGLDIQGGGSDLIFPHHEFTAAHAESVSGERRFARHYVHAGMIGLDGHKMSKSRGNLVLVSGCAPRASSRRLFDWACWPGTIGPIAIGALKCCRRPTRGCIAGEPRPHFPPARTPPTSSPECAAISPTTWIRPKRLLHLMVGLPTRSNTAVTTPRRRGRSRRRWMRCWGWTCNRRGK